MTCIFKCLFSTLDYYHLQHLIPTCSHNPLVTISKLKHPYYLTGEKYETCEEWASVNSSEANISFIEKKVSVHKKFNAGILSSFNEGKFTNWASQSQWVFKGWLSNVPVRIKFMGNAGEVLHKLLDLINKKGQDFD